MTLRFLEDYNDSESVCNVLIKVTIHQATLRQFVDPRSTSGNRQQVA